MVIIYAQTLEISGEMKMSESERWLSVEEIAAHLGVSRETIYRWLEKRKIPAHRIGKLWKFQVSEIDEWIRNGGGSTTNEDQDAKS